MDEGVEDDFEAIRADLEPARDQTVTAIEGADDPEVRADLIETLHGIARQLRTLDKLEARFRESLAENRLLREQLRDSGLLGGAGRDRDG